MNRNSELGCREEPPQDLLGRAWELQVVGRSLVAEVPQPLLTESRKGLLPCRSCGILLESGGSGQR